MTRMRKAISSLTPVSPSFIYDWPSRFALRSEVHMLASAPTTMSLPTSARASTRPTPTRNTRKATRIWPPPVSIQSTRSCIVLRLGGRERGRGDRALRHLLQIGGDPLQIRELLGIELHVDPVRRHGVAGVRDGDTNLAEDSERGAFDVNGVGVHKRGERLDGRLLALDLLQHGHDGPCDFHDVMSDAGDSVLNLLDRNHSG